MEEMTELEIQNFALNFYNLINEKKAEIGALKTDNGKLSATLSGYIQAGRELTEIEIRAAKRPVFAFHKGRWASKEDFWAVPLHDGTGVITSRKGVYRYSDYGKTWFALSDEPIKEDVTI